MAKNAAGGTEFDGEIKVAARVIDILSSGLYQNAASCMKELINNSYDADAARVLVSVKPDADVVVIEDDGVGMTQDQFQEHFDHVAESHKRDGGDRTPKGRLKIGKIGIGFIAANELCDEMEIYSTVAGSTELLHVTIEFGAIRERPIELRKRGDREFVKGDYHGELLDAEAEEQFTKIYLKRLRPSAVDEFLKPNPRIGQGQRPSLYGLPPGEVRQLLASLSSWDELDLYSQTRLRIGLNVPVRYLPDWFPPKYAEQLDAFTERALAHDFQVIYDGTDLYKPTVLREEIRGASVLTILKHESEENTAFGYLFSRHGAMKPREINGVLIRIREAAVAEYDRGYLGYPAQLSVMFQAWTTGEVYVEGDLDDALNIDRRTLRDTHPAFLDVQTWFLEQFAAHLSRVRADLYSKPAEKRKQNRASDQKKQLDAVAETADRLLGHETGAALREAYAPDARTSSTKPASRREASARQATLLKRLSVAEVYEIVIEVAAETLPQEQAERFIAELARRLA